jgi:hypothetical protein
MLIYRATTLEQKDGFLVGESKQATRREELNSRFLRATARCIVDQGGK